MGVKPIAVGVGRGWLSLGVFTLLPKGGGTLKLNGTLINYKWYGLSVSAFIVHGKTQEHGVATGVGAG